MEPDLEKILDFESCGDPFPQFADRWESALGRASAVVREAEALRSGRVRVGLNVAGVLEFVASFCAIARSEIDLFLFNPKWGSEELNTARRIAQLHCEIVSCEVDFVGLENRELECSGEFLSQGANPLRVMIPTGGSSGRIRFAVHDWGTLSASAFGFQSRFTCERMAAHCVLPLYHVSGFMQLIRAMLSGGRVVFGGVNDFVSVHSLMLVEERNNRFLSLVPTQLERLLQDASNFERLRSYRAIFVGGGPASERLIQQARQSRLPLAPTYGMTETAAQVATLLPELFLDGVTGQGTAMPHVKIEIVKEGDTAELAEPGEVGLIRISGSSLFHGYYGEQNGLNAFALLTSDLGKLDERSRLTVVGRADRMVITGGEKVDPRELELVFERSGFVDDVACFGRDDQEWGQVICVAYVPKQSSCSEDDLRTYVRQELVNYKMPKIWIRKEKLPRNAAGKLLLKQLIETAGI